jgi:hypothetical protein
MNLYLLNFRSARAIYGKNAVRFQMVVVSRPLQCAGINRHEAEEEESLRVRTSEPLGPEFCTWHREVFGEA